MGGEGVAPASESNWGEGCWGRGGLVAAYTVNTNVFSTKKLTIFVEKNFEHENFLSQAMTDRLPERSMTYLSIFLN